MGRSCKNKNNERKWRNLVLREENFEIVDLFFLFGNSSPPIITASAFNANTAIQGVAISQDWHPPFMRGSEYLTRNAVEIAHPISSIADRQI